MGMQLILRWRYVGLALVLLFTLSACSPVVIIPDKALQQTLRREVDKPLSLFLTKRDLEKVRELDASNLNIRNLEGLQYCENLLDLRLANNSIKSITQLGALRNLVRLDLGGNQVTNIQPIAGLSALDFLDLSGEGNAIVDWSPLESNVLTGGLGPDNTVRVSARYTMDDSGEPLPSFAGAYDAMRDRDVVVLIED